MTNPTNKLAELLAKQGTLRSKNPGINNLLDEVSAKTNKEGEKRQEYEKAHQKNTYNRAIAKI